MNNHHFNMDVGSLGHISNTNMLYFISPQAQRVCLPHPPQQPRTTEEWNPTLLMYFPLLHLHETFCFHHSDASVCRIVREQLKRKPSADSEDLQFCCRPAQYCFIRSRLCFERSVIWSQLASQIHFWQYAILTVSLTQNNSSQKAISTFTIQKSKISIGRVTQKSNFLHLIQCSLKKPNSEHFNRSCQCHVLLDLYSIEV